MLDALTMKHTFMRFLAFAGFASSAVAADFALKVGECWSYASRPGEENSFLVVQKIETLPKTGEVVHISIFGLRIKSPGAPNGITDQIGHLPISGMSLRASLKEKVHRKVPEVDWAEGYQMWLEAKGGAFTKPVSACIDFVEEAINHGKQS